MTGVAFNMNANAVVHAASTPVTAHHGVPHGVANAIFLAPGLDLIRPGCEEKLARDRRGARRGRLRAVRRPTPRGGGRGGAPAVRDCDLPPTLRAWGLDPATMDIPRLIEDAMKSRNIATNPRPIGPAELAELYSAVQG